MRILHTSDMHGDRQKLLNALNKRNWDVWVDTGDMLPNLWQYEANDIPRPDESGLPGFRNPTWAARNHTFQANWLRINRLAEEISQAMSGRRGVGVRGNHDYLSIAPILRYAGADFTELEHGVALEIDGQRFAGFGEVPLELARWSGETPQRVLDGIVAATLATRPTVLCTHAPPHGVLDRAAGFSTWHTGVEAIDHEISSEITHHLFGHVHASAGQKAKVGGVLCCNGAEHAKVYRV